MKKKEIMDRVLRGEFWLLAEVRKVAPSESRVSKAGKAMQIAEHRLENLNGDPVQLTEIRMADAAGKFQAGMQIPPKGTLVAVHVSELQSEFGRAPYKVSAADLVPVED